MAATVVGFKFTDGIFFNAFCTEEEVNSLQGELGEWRAPGLAAEKASQYGLHLHSTSFLNEVKIGGFQEGHQIGVLHQILNTEEQVCVENQRECTSSENAHTEAQVPLRNEEHVPTEGVSIWTHEKVLLLIELYREHRALFSNSAIKRHEVWRKIASQIHEKGHHVTGIKLLPMGISHREEGEGGGSNLIC
ncbi:uncharacterized protein LOC112565833 isoform X2 [Pomacea canaliculata]|uniref:uncharacterized protein LOC112565833 isoform X2 n=1 Tax=Pomacea canaliculata TaxID=400727 RepID=UPI000D72C6F7|nr:uncharacterized protein LOC112565833 isoform X2 [Pomacea canaliculata]